MVIVAGSPVELLPSQQQFQRVEGSHITQMIDMVSHGFTANLRSPACAHETCIRNLGHFTASDLSLNGEVFLPCVRFTHRIRVTHYSAITASISCHQTRKCMLPVFGRWSHTLTISWNLGWDFNWAVPPATKPTVCNPPWTINHSTSMLKKYTEAVVGGVSNSSAIGWRIWVVVSHRCWNIVIKDFSVHYWRHLHKTAGQYPYEDTSKLHGDREECQEHRFWSVWERCVYIKSSILNFQLMLLLLLSKNSKEQNYLKISLQPSRKIHTRVPSWLASWLQIAQVPCILMS